MTNDQAPMTNEGRTPFIRWFAEIGERDADSVGGKGFNLGLMTATGLPVPPGFVITQEAYRADRARRAGPDLREAILAAYEQLGRGLVAVRSSASGEDGAELSFAGQQETILGVEGEGALLDAVERCWASLHEERAVAYRRAQRVDEASMAMAVVVQRLVPSDVSGVLFTRDPLDPTGRQLLIEAAPGLGEAVVSGRVTPDRYHVERETGTIVEQSIAEKKERLTAQGWSAIAAHEQKSACLSADQVGELARLSASIEQFYGEPRDVEWAISGGQVFVLQARPITAAGAVEIETVRREEIERVKALAGSREVIWARYNLAEVLPTPTPLTWSIVKHFMSGRGAFGQMFRDLGYDPDPELDEAGFLDLICGRPYVDLDREPKLFFCDFPFGYDFAAIRARPEAGMYPKLVTVPSRKTSRFWWRLPAIAWQMFKSTSRISGLMPTESKRLTEEVYPQFAATAAADRRIDFGSMKYNELCDHWLKWTRCIDEFGRHSLRPGVLAATALAELEQLLAASGVDRPAEDARRLVMGVKPPPQCDLAGALRRLAEGTLTREDFLAGFAHRGAQEMELAAPRWSETPELLPKAGSAPLQPDAEPASLEELVNLKKYASLRKKLQAAMSHARTYLGLREASKHYLMLGWERLRMLLREIGLRLGVGDGIFYLDEEEIPGGYSLVDDERRAWLTQRSRETKRRQKLLLALAAPPVLFSDDPEAIGRPVAVEGAAEWTATPLSFGQFEGPALVLEQPISADHVTPGFVLVCSSTDPAWVPLFLKAGALVMESGGVLSHGAIVAREFGIPAVAGIANVQRRLKSGQRVRVDGTSGRVHVFES